MMAGLAKTRQNINRLKLYRVYINIEINYSQDLRHGNLHSKWPFVNI